MPTLNLSRRPQRVLGPLDEPAPPVDSPPLDRTNPFGGNRTTNTAPSVETREPSFSTPFRTGAQAHAPTADAPPASAGSFGERVRRALYPDTPAPTPVSFGPHTDWNRANLTAFFASRGVGPEEVPYWEQKRNEPEFRDNPEYFWSKLQNAQSFGGGGNAGGGYGGNDVYVNEILSRLQQLHQPINDPLKPLYDLMSLKRIESLNGAPFTEGDDAALRAKYLAPLTQARDAALTRNQEQIGARGFLPSSGLAIGQQNAIEGNYEQAVAGSTSDMATQAIAEKQRRADEQLQILSDMLGTNRGMRNEDNGRSQDLVSTAQLLSQLDAQTLSQLLQASGNANDGGSLNELINLIMGQQNHKDAQGQNNAALYGQIIATILGGLK